VGGTAGWGIAGGALLGPVGLLAGLLLGGRGKNITFVCRFNDGRKILATTDEQTFAKIKTAVLKGEMDAEGRRGARNAPTRANDGAFAGVTARYEAQGSGVRSTEGVARTPREPRRRGLFSRGGERFTFFEALVLIALGGAVWWFALLPLSSRLNSRPGEQADLVGAAVTRSREQIPSPGPSYSIIRTNTVPGIKRSLSVRLNKKVSEQTLRSIALELKAQDSGDYDRTFITYYLPGMPVGSGAWATTHFNPRLKIEILGLSEDDEQRLVAQPVSPGRRIIGQWFDETPMVGGRLTIGEDGDRLFLEWTLKDGGTIKDDLVESKSPFGRRFDKVGGSGHGDCWVIGSDGNLQLRDNQGLITTARKIP